MSDRPWIGRWTLAVIAVCVYLWVALLLSYARADTYETAYNACIADLERLIFENEAEILTIDSLVAIYRGPYRGSD